MFAHAMLVFFLIIGKFLRPPAQVQWISAFGWIRGTLNFSSLISTYRISEEYLETSIQIVILASASTIGTRKVEISKQFFSL